MEQEQREHYVPADEDTVNVGDQCPNCGEGCVDCLVWIEDTHIQCLTCGYVYEVR